jgi:uncharacterized membrane protein YraQ (UPF0718 family)
MPSKIKWRGLGGWLFLAVVVSAYGLMGLTDPESTTQALTFFLRVMWQVLPVLGLVFILLFITNLFLDPKWIKRYLGKGAGLKGWVAAVFGGILSIGPIYVWYAVLSELHAKGMRTALIATFLYSRAVKLPLLPLMVHYFGVTYTLVLCVYLVLFAGINGILVEKLVTLKT